VRAQSAPTSAADTLHSADPTPFRRRSDLVVGLTCTWHGRLRVLRASPMARCLLECCNVLGAMGPVDAPRTDGGKVFAGLHASYAGLVQIHEYLPTLCYDLWRRALQCRSQRHRSTWERIAQLAAEFLPPPPRLVHPWPSERFAVKYPRWKPLRESRSPGSVRGVLSNGHLYRDGTDLWYFWESKGPKTSCRDSLVGVPDVASSQIKMLPVQRRQMF
jgi:hypothetical protein